MKGGLRCICTKKLFRVYIVSSFIINRMKNNNVVHHNEFLSKLSFALDWTKQTKSVYASFHPNVYIFKYDKMCTLDSFHTHGIEWVRFSCCPECIHKPPHRAPSLVKVSSENCIIPLLHSQKASSSKL